MTEPTLIEMAHYVVELNSGCWHKWIDRYDSNRQRCTCGKKVHLTSSEITNHIELSNPTFIDDAGVVQLLRLMLNRTDRDEFLVEIGGLSKHGKHLDVVLVDYITDNQHEGLLLKVAYEFLKERNEDEKEDG